MSPERAFSPPRRSRGSDGILQFSRWMEMRSENVFPETTQKGFWILLPVKQESTLKNSRLFRVTDARCRHRHMLNSANAFPILRCIWRNRLFAHSTVNCFMPEATTFWLCFHRKMHWRRHNRLPQETEESSMGLVCYLVGKTSAELRDVTAETMAYLNYLRRFASKGD